MTYLVSCVSKKRMVACAAKDLYISDWFSKAKAFVAGSPYFILSAKYGLLAPERVVRPYEATLVRMPRAERENWSKNVLLAIQKRISQRETVVILAGHRYTEFLVPLLKQNGYVVLTPMKGLAIGKQLAWLRNNTVRPRLF